MESSPLIVFGAQITNWPSKEFLAKLRDLLLQDPQLSEFLQAIRDLPSWWNKLVAFDPRFKKVDATDSLQDLLQWVERGELLWQSDVLPNVLFTPFTVIIQFILYHRYKQTHQDDKKSSPQTQAGVQGFCTGFLMATALSLSKDEAELAHWASVTLRLALIIGAAVDLDSITSSEPKETSCLALRWKQDTSKQDVEKVIKTYPGSYISVHTEANSCTLTVPRASLIAVAHDLTRSGFGVREIGLQGRFHSRDLQDSFDSLKRFCKANTDLQLPTADRLNTSLRSNIDSEKITKGDLHSIALQTLLVEVADWNSTISAAVKDLHEKKGDRVVVVGTVNCIPKSLVRDFNLSVSKLAESNVLMGSQLSDAMSTSGSSPQVSTPLEDNMDARYPDNAVAVIGMSCRFPGADSVAEFWDLIKSGTSMCEEVPANRFKTKDLRRNQNGDIKFFGNFIKDPDSFDHRFFKKSSREAGQMDPQQRVLLEVAYEAMESAGYFGDFSRTSDDIGVYVGVCASDYNDNVASHPPTAFSSLGTLRAFLSGKISHYFGWSGPSVTYDTACSSSAVALDAACKAIITGDCSQAIAGGANILTTANFYQNLKAGGFLSPTGPTKSFDARADGYCRGEGVGLVVLKKLSSAIENGDKILGVISGTAVNQNSNAVSITVPYSASQISLYEKVSKLAKINPLEVSYVEAHGTGTPVGDPIECESIRKVFGGPERQSTLHLGSIKANIGHTESTSGVAGLIKVLLMMQNREIPPQANFISLNPKIPPLESDRIAISQSSKEWNTQFLSACVNNYGAAGSNAAMIVCQAPSSGVSPNIDLAAKAQETQDTRYPIYVSAHSAQSLTSYCQKLLEEVKKLDKQSQKQVILSNLAFNLSRKKNRSHGYLFNATVSSLSELRKQLEEALSSTAPFYTQVKANPLPVVLVFGGQIGDSVGLPLEVYKSSGRLRYHLEACDTSLRKLGHPSLFPGIFETESIEDVVSLHSMLFAVQYSFAKTWIDCGLKIDAMLGHSFGQLTALCASGSLSLEHGLKLVAGRAKLMKSRWGPERGSMISLEACEDCISKIVEITNKQDSKYEVEIACYNGPSSYVLVGSHESINYVEELIASKPESLQVKKWKRLSVPYGFHSRFTEPLLSELLKLARTLDFKKPSIPLETCSDQRSWKEITADLVADHTRSPVYFDQAVDRLSKRLGSCTWIEAGMNSSVTGMVRHILSKSKDSEDNYHPINIGKSEALGSLAKATVQLWNQSQPVHFWPFHHAQAQQYDYINLPSYQFEKTRHWIEWIDHADPPPAETLVIQPQQIEPAIFMTLIDKDESKTRFRFDPRFDQYKLFVQGHRVLDQPLCPAPLYFELATQAIQSILDDPAHTLISLEGLEIKAPLGLATDRFLYLTLEEISGVHDTWSFEFSSESRDDEEPMTSQHAAGKVILQNPRAASLVNEFQRYERLIGFDRTQFLSNDPDTESIQGSLIYKVFEKVVHYDPYYKGVRRVFAKDHEIAGQVRLTENENEVFQTTSTNPLLIDNFVQVSGLHINSLYDCGEDDVYVCTKIDRVQPTPEFKNHNSTAQSWTVYSSFSVLSEREVMNDIFVFDDSSKALVAYMLGCRFTRVAMRSLSRVLMSANLSYSSRKGSTSSVVGSAPMSRGPTEIPAPVIAPPKVVETAPVVVPVAVPVAAPVAAPVAVSTSPSFSNAIRSLLAKTVDIDIKEIKDDSTPDDLGIDSLMITEVLSEIQTVFEVTIPMDDFVTLTTVKKLEDYLQPKVKGDFQQDASPSSIGTNTPDTSSETDSEVETAATLTTGNVTPDDFQLKLMTLLQSHLEIDTVINPKDNLADCGLDSLICMELVSDIEKEFGQRIDPTLLTNDSTFGDLYQLVFPNQSLKEKTSAPKQEASTTKPVSRAEVVIQSSQPSPKTSSLDQVQQHFRDISRDYDSYAAKTGFANFWSTTYLAQARLVAAYTVEAFNSLGCSLTSLKAGSRLPDVQVLQKHDLLLAQLYRILESESLIEIRGEEKIRTSKAVDQTHSSTLLERILRDFPQHASEHKLLDITGSKLADCMTGAADPLMLLFRPAANRALLEDVYTNGPMYEAITKQLGSYFEKAFGNPSDGQVFEILELGGGTGGTTKYIVELLSKLNIPVRYTFTDISSSLVSAAKRKFAGKDFMQYKVINIEKEPPEIELERYHAILSTNCIHATSDLTVSGTNMRKMLRQDGFIALVEFTRNMFWFDLVFGLLDGWWFYKDGRDHVLASEYFWEKSLRNAGFKHVAWTGADTEESNTLRIITAYRKPAATASQTAGSDQSATEETLLYKQVGSTSLFADVYYPTSLAKSAKSRPVALMVHGGGFVMLSRKDVRPKQTSMLLDKGFLPVSIDYRLVPEVNVLEGSMMDVCDAMQWARYTLPYLARKRPDVQISPDNLVIVGWSTGGHLSMTSAWTSIDRGIEPPSAILAFYCPTDFEDECWYKANIPEGSESGLNQDYDLLEGVYSQPITSYNIPANRGAIGGWLSPSDARSRIILHMNWTDQFVPILLNGLPSHSQTAESSSSTYWKTLPRPKVEDIRSISPLAQIKAGKYQVPTFLLHTDADDLIPIEQAERTYRALKEQGVSGCEFVTVKGVPHLFDLYKKFAQGETGEAVSRAYEWLGEKVGL